MAINSVHNIVTSEVVLGLGSNMGDRLSYLSYAVNQLNESAGMIKAVSSVWETEPWGFEAEELFLNMVVKIDTPLDPKSLLKTISMLEMSLGRKRRKGGEYNSRVIDIDILLWGEKIIAMPGLQIPHPHIPARRFVLEPLCEIAPEAIHPVSHMTMRDLLVLCRDDSKVRIYHEKL